jgi:ABC-2 type transport system permease protein
VASCYRFSFRTDHPARVRKQRSQSVKRQVIAAANIRPAQEQNSIRHQYLTFMSFSRIHLLSVLKGRPFLLILMIWTFFLGMELKNAIAGDSRMGIPYVSTGLLVNTITEVLPVFALLVMFFYSTELLWKSRTVRFAMIEGSTAVNPLMEFCSKLLVLCLISSVLLLYSCLLCGLIQAASGTAIDSGLYLSQFYFLGFPLMLSAILVLGIQEPSKYKYPGLALASLLILLSSSPLGSLVGISNPLFRVAVPFNVPYQEMNGYGGYVKSFGIKMIYSAAVAGLAMLAVFWFKFRQKVSAAVTVLIPLLFLAGGTYLYYQTYVDDPRLSGSALNDWKQEYEQQFHRFKNLRQPSVTSVRTEVDLFPRNQRYQVRGTYRLKNKSQYPIDSLLIAVNSETSIQDLRFQRKGKKVEQQVYGHYWYFLDLPLKPGESMDMSFSFSSGWTGFKGHSAFNSIIWNGSFIRISNYFPRLGYDDRNEITNSLERRMRGMAEQDKLPALRSTATEPYNYDFIDLHAIVSTDSDQVAIGQGVLQKQWKTGGRNYFSYQTERPIPFRFALSSARYQVQRSRYRNIGIEVYYHPAHSENVRRLIDQVKQTLAYCEKNFAPYPHPVIRFAEVSAFAEGFGATAYPSTIYMKEDGGFHTNLDDGPETDIINLLAGHELSHEWWGSAQMSPEVKEGGWVMTETLAKYTEQMLYLHARGPEALRRMVGRHLEEYSSLRSFSKETALYKTTYDTPHIPYNKGSVVMYQLYLLIGEKAINKALHKLLENYSYPMLPPDTEDLLEELHRVSTAAQRVKIDELFKKIVTYDLKMGEVSVKRLANGYELTFEASAGKFLEVGQGNSKDQKMNAAVDFLVETEGKTVLTKFIPDGGKIRGRLVMKEKPLKVTIDPGLTFMDVFQKDNEVMVNFQ